MIDQLLKLFRRQGPQREAVAATEPPIETWNRLGRRYVSELNALIARSYELKEAPDGEPKDPRTLDQARAILAAVEAHDRSGHWRADAPLADRAHGPLIPMLNDVGQNLNCVCVLGPDAFLIRPGTSYQPGTALHLRGGEVIERPDILAAATTRSHDLLLVVSARGFSIGPGLDADPVVLFPWPESVAPQALDLVQVSEDGRTLAFTEGEEAVWLGQAHDDGMTWTRVYPSAAFLAEREAELDEEEEDFGWSDSMMHCALSPDGRFIAYGSQCYGHFIDRIDGVGQLRRWAEIGQLSEYPHDACFSDDSAVAALNSCHFYHGATVGVRLADIEGAQTPPYEEDPRTRLIDGRLRVYASTWLPLEAGEGGFALAGGGDLDIVSPKGDLRGITSFGSSASSIDYCPKTGLLAVASYSGFLHVFDPSRPAQADAVIGYRPIHERYRWVLWRDRPPFRW
jgi:hypothetical protein